MQCNILARGNCVTGLLARKILRTNQASSLSWITIIWITAPKLKHSKIRAAKGYWEGTSFVELSSEGGGRYFSEDFYAVGGGQMQHRIMLRPATSASLPASIQKWGLDWSSAWAGWQRAGLGMAARHDIPFLLQSMQVPQCIVDPEGAMNQSQNVVVLQTMQCVKIWICGLGRMAWCDQWAWTAVCQHWELLTKCAEHSTWPWSKSLIMPLHMLFACAVDKPPVKWFTELVR